MNISPGLTPRRLFAKEDRQSPTIATAPTRAPTFHSSPTIIEAQVEAKTAPASPRHVFELPRNGCPSGRTSPPSIARLRVFPSSFFIKMGA